MTDIVLTRKKLIDDKSGVIHEIAYANSVEGCASRATAC